MKVTKSKRPTSAACLLLFSTPNEGHKGPSCTKPYQFSPSQGLLQAVGLDSVFGGAGVAGGDGTDTLCWASAAARDTAIRQTKHKYCTIVDLLVLRPLNYNWLRSTLTVVGAFPNPAGCGLLLTTELHL